MDVASKKIDADLGKGGEGLSPNCSFSQCALDATKQWATFVEVHKKLQKPARKWDNKRIDHFVSAKRIDFGVLISLTHNPTHKLLQFNHQPGTKTRGAWSSARACAGAGVRSSKGRLCERKEKDTDRIIVYKRRNRNRSKRKDRKGIHKNTWEEDTYERGGVRQGARRNEVDNKA